MVTTPRQRLDELLFARATEGLSHADALELEPLLAAYPDVDSTGYERAAAAVCLAASGLAVRAPAAGDCRLPAPGPAWPPQRREHSASTCRKCR